MAIINSFEQVFKGDLSLAELDKEIDKQFSHLRAAFINYKSAERVIAEEQNAIEQRKKIKAENEKELELQQLQAMAEEEEAKVQEQVARILKKHYPQYSLEEIRDLSEDKRTELINRVFLNEAKKTRLIERATTTLFDMELHQHPEILSKLDNDEENTFLPNYYLEEKHRKKLIAIIRRYNPYLPEVYIENLGDTAITELIKAILNRESIKKELPEKTLSFLERIMQSIEDSDAQLTEVLDSYDSALNTWIIEGLSDASKLKLKKVLFNYAAEQKKLNHALLGSNLWRLKYRPTRIAKEGKESVERRMLINEVQQKKVNKILKKYYPYVSQDYIDGFDYKKQLPLINRLIFEDRLSKSERDILLIGLIQNRNDVKERKYSKDDIQILEDWGLHLETEPGELNEILKRHTTFTAAEIKALSNKEKLELTRHILFSYFKPTTKEKFILRNWQEHKEEAAKIVLKYSRGLKKADYEKLNTEKKEQLIKYVYYIEPQKVELAPSEKERLAIRYCKLAGNIQPILTSLILGRHPELSSDSFDTMSDDEKYKIIKDTLYANGYYSHVLGEIGKYAGLERLSVERLNESQKIDIIKTIVLVEKKQTQLKEVLRKHSSTYSEEMFDFLDTPTKESMMKELLHDISQKTYLRGEEERLASITPEEKARIDNILQKYNNSPTVKDIETLPDDDILLMLRYYLLSKENQSAIGDIFSKHDYMTQSDINCLGANIKDSMARDFINEENLRPKLNEILSKCNQPLTEDDIKRLTADDKEAIIRYIFSTERRAFLHPTAQEVMDNYINQHQQSQRKLTRILAEFSLANKQDIDKEKLLAQQEKALENLNEEEKRDYLLQLLNQAITGSLSKQEQDLLARRGLPIENSKIKHQLPKHSQEEIKRAIWQCEQAIEDSNNMIESAQQEKEKWPKESIYRRGKIIKLYQQRIAKEKALGISGTETAKKLQDQLKFQKAHIDEILANNQKSPNKSISKEFFLRCTRALASHNEIKASAEDNRQEAVKETIIDAKAAASSLAKISTFGVTKVINSSAGLIATAIAFPLYAEGCLSKKLNFESPFEGQSIKNMSQRLATAIRAKMNEVEKEIRRK